jgi:hypothetical protein
MIVAVKRAQTIDVSDQHGGSAVDKVDSDQLRFEVTKPRVAWSRAVFDVALSTGSNSQASDYNKGSSIMLYNSNGDHRRIGRMPTEQEARDQVAVMQRDLGLLSTHAWCEKYGVPISFVTG